jgi:hypothetical protein
MHPYGYAFSNVAGGTQTNPVAVSQPSGGYFYIYGTKASTDNNVDDYIRLDGAVDSTGSKRMDPPVSGMGATEWSYQVWGVDPATNPHKVEITAQNTIKLTTWISV